MLSKQKKKKDSFKNLKHHKFTKERNIHTLNIRTFPLSSSSRSFRINTRILPFSFQVQRDLHGVDVRSTNWIDDIHVRKDRFGAVGLAKHRRKYRGPIGGYKEQTKGEQLKYFSDEYK